MPPSEDDDTGPDLGTRARPAAEEPRVSRLGRYQILFELARGGMGVVYAGRLPGPRGFDRVVAIKRLGMVDAGEQEIASFLSEAKVTARINHPNVVSTFELGEHDHSFFLVMELVEGASLARLLRSIGDRSERLDPRLVAWIGSQAAAGLHAAHELRGEGGEPLGLVHRDVSPENILLSFDGRVHVADFGVAKFIGADRTTSKGVLKGKFAYMSPEQAKGEALDRRSDVFSLGVVLHEALVGRRLFAGNSAVDTMRRVLDMVPPSPRDERPDVPEELSAIVLRCLEKDREARFESAEEVGAALGRFLREGPTTGEGDLARRMAWVFPGEQDELRERIRMGSARHDDEAAGAPRGDISVAATIGPATLRLDRRVLGTGAIAALAGVAIALAVWAIRGPRTREAPATRPAASALSAPLPAVSSGSIAASASPTASASAAASVRPAHTVAPVAEPRPPSSAHPPASTSSRSQRGVPFQSLGD